MRLYNVDRPKLEDFSTRRLSKYGILSHRWAKKEPTFNDISQWNRELILQSDKYRGFFDQAKQDGLRYVWMDTCCIDKTNNSELGEAINSMYQWYRNAAICYVYLHDVNQETPWQTALPRSAWFRRGWTLQELLAPQKVVFYDRKWRRLGDKAALADQISQITGIDSEILRTGDLTKSSVAQKMSWAARRETSRMEDHAYCLMGLFGVNMDLRYGEGEQAFIRLQEEIIQRTDDNSIFAWSMSKKLPGSGLLAPYPRCFKDSQRMVSAVFTTRPRPFSRTNRGLSIKLEITPWAMDTYLAYLDCGEEGEKEADTHRARSSTRIGIFLRRLNNHDQYIRVKFAGNGLWHESRHDKNLRTRPRRFRRIFVPQTSDLKPYNQDSFRARTYGFRISGACLLPDSYIYGCPVYLNSVIVTLPPGHWGRVAVIDLSAQDRGLRKIALGFDFDFNPICLLEDSFLNPENTEREFDWLTVLSDDLNWNTIIEGARVYRPASHEGTWALKGHRLYDLKNGLSGLNVVISTSPWANGSLVRMRRDTTEIRSLWEFDIDILDGPFSKTLGQSSFDAYGVRFLRNAVPLVV